MRGVQLNADLIALSQALRREGLSIDNICRRLNLSKSTIHPYIKDIVLTTNQRSQLKQNSRIGTIRSNKLRKGHSRPHNRVQRWPDFCNELIDCLAHFMFDASLIGSQACYYNRSRELVEKQRIYVAELFGIEGRITLKASGVLRLQCDSVELVDLMRHQQKEMLGFILNCDKEWQRTFIRAFFDDEGCITTSLDYKRYTISGSQKKVETLWLIRSLLGNFGIQSNIYKSKTRVPIVRIIGGKESVRRFAQEIGFSSGITLNPLRKNARYSYAIEKREILKRVLQTFAQAKL